MVLSPTEKILKLTLGLSMAGIWVGGSPMRKRPKDRYVGLEKLSDKALRVLNVDRPLVLTTVYTFSISGSVVGWYSTRILLLPGGA